MSKSQPSQKIDVLANVLKMLGTNRSIPTKDADEAKKQYNDLTKDLAFYKNFYQENQGSYSKQTKTSEDKKSKHDETKNGEDPSSGGPNAFKKLKEENKKLDFEKQNLQKQVDELKNRLSAVTGQKLTNDNPDIADLSDPYRPTYLAEKFRQIYDDEWTHAYEELEETHDFDEKKLIDFLCTIIKELDKFCGEFSQQQLDRIYMYAVDDITNPKVQRTTGKGDSPLTAGMGSELDQQQTERAKMMIRDFRKSISTSSIRPLTQIFDKTCMEKLKQSVPSSRKSTDLNKFIEKALEVIWMMKIQHPPLVLVWQTEGKKPDKDRFVFYTKRGDCVKQTVWPAVCLHSEGPLMSKGILQAK